MPLLQQAGVTLLAGTDAGFLNSFNYPGIGLHDELALLVASGLTPAQALQASVVNGPRFLKAAEAYGAIAPGKSPTCWCWSAIRSTTSRPRGRSGRSS